MIKTGQVYKHYKGHIYEVIGVARHSESLEEMVVYVRHENPADMWVRPKAMFEEKTSDGWQRFELIKEVP